MRRAQQALAAAERDAVAREAALAAAAGEAASLGRAHHEAQVEIRQLLQDIQARSHHPTHGIVKSFLGTNKCRVMLDFSVKPQQAA